MSKTISQKQILLLCILLTPIINIGLDMYSPSLPALQAYFHTTAAAVNLSILLYTAAFGITQPLIGPASDKYGRKPFVWAALIIYFIGSIAASLSQSLSLLYLARITQGIGAAIIAANIKAMLVDRFEGTMLAKANSYFSLSWSLTPILAPALGGYLQNHFSWQSNFIVMSIYTLICIAAASRFLTETKPSESTHTKKIAFLKTWRQLLTSATYLSYTLILALQFAILLLYYLFAPYVIQTELHYSAADYGKIMLLLGSAYLAGNIVNRLLLNYLEIKTIILTGLVLLLMTSISMLVIAAQFPLSLATVTIPVFVLFFWDGLIFPNTLTHCLQRYKKIPATAASLIGGLLNIFCAVITSLSNHFLNLHSMIDLSVIYNVFAIVSIFLFFYLFSNRSFKAVTA